MRLRWLISGSRKLRVMSGFVPSRFRVEENRMDFRGPRPPFPASFACRSTLAQ